MRCRHRSKDLERVEQDPAATIGHGHAIDRAFRRRMQLLRAARDERDLRSLKSLHFERLKGSRSHQWSIRLNDQWRLILEFEEDPNGKVVIIVSVEDYH
jgi:proteic killer suppression protein